MSPLAPEIVRSLIWFLLLSLVMIAGVVLMSGLLPMQAFREGPLLTRIVCLLNLVLGGLVLYLGLALLLRKRLWLELRKSEEGTGA